MNKYFGNRSIDMIFYLYSMSNAQKFLHRFFYLKRYLMPLTRVENSERPRSHSRKYFITFLSISFYTYWSYSSSLVRSVRLVSTSNPKNLVPQSTLELGSSSRFQSYTSKAIFMVEKRRLRKQSIPQVGQGYSISSEQQQIQAEIHSNGQTTPSPFSISLNILPSYQMINPSGFFYQQFNPYLHAGVLHAVLFELMRELEKIQWAEGILNTQIFRLIGLGVEVLDASFLDLLFFEPFDDLLMRVHLEFLPHLLQLDLLLLLSGQFLRSLLLLQRSHYQNLAVLFHILREGLLILSQQRCTLSLGFIKFIFPYQMLKIWQIWATRSAKDYT